MATIRVRAPLACRIVNLDRVKFNDAVASGTYPCAPPTMKGSARLFDEESLIPLYFFARLTEFGIPAGRAGQLACEMARTARQTCYAASDRIILVRGQSGEFFTGSVTTYAEGVGKEPKHYDPLHETTKTEEFPEGSCFIGIGRVLFTVEFYVSHVRKIIADAIDHERNILGEEEEV